MGLSWGGLHRIRERERERRERQRERERERERESAGERWRHVKGRRQTKNDNSDFHVEQPGKRLFSKNGSAEAQKRPKP